MAKSILSTTTEISRDNGNVSILTYYSMEKLFEMFIPNEVNSKNGVSYLENELVAEIGYEDISISINNKGELVIVSGEDKSFSINTNGELIMEEQV